ncbi:MAG: acyl-CoA dehydrogenase, partial [Paracoccaceae bacterium]
MSNETQSAAIFPDLLELCQKVIPTLGSVLESARLGIAAKVMVGGRVSGKAVEENQFAAHGLSWFATYVESLRQLSGWAENLNYKGQFGEMEQLILQIAFGEYLCQLEGGISMSQGEVVRAHDLGIEGNSAFTDANVVALSKGNTDVARKRLVELMIERDGVAVFGATGLDDEYEMIRDQFRRFSDEKVVPFAHEWHLKDELIP